MPLAQSISLKIAVEKLLSLPKEIHNETIEHLASDFSRESDFFAEETFWDLHYERPHRRCVSIMAAQSDVLKQDR